MFYSSFVILQVSTRDILCGCSAVGVYTGRQFVGYFPRACLPGSLNLTPLIKFEWDSEPCFFVLESGFNAKKQPWVSMINKKNTFLNNICLTK